MMPGPIHLKDKYRKPQEEAVPELDVPALTVEIVGKLFDADTIQPFMSGRAEAVVFAVLSAANTSHASARLQTLETALREIADPPSDGCGCEHDTPDCCANVKDYHCPECIAWAALRGREPETK